MDSFIILNHINEIIAHKNVTMIGDLKMQAQLQLPTPLSISLRYVFLSSIDDQTLKTMIYDDKLNMYFYIYNTRNNQVSEQESPAIKSTIWYHTNAEALLEMVPNEVKETDKTPLTGPTVDFALATSRDAEIEVWKHFIADAGNELDLSGFYFLHPRVIIEAAVKAPQVDTIIVNQNMLLCDSFSWLFYFPNLNALSITYSPITDQSLERINKYAPELVLVDINHCLNITGRCLLELTKCSGLEEIVINGDNCKMQENKFETVITDEEWKTLSSGSLTSLEIDSTNLSMDFINYCLKSFHCLTRFIVNPTILQKLEKTARSGHSDQRVYFYSSEDLNNCFYRYKDIKIADLVSNKIGPCFSESMLRKIKEIDPDKIDTIDKLNA
jgi:hypothetical protein